MLWRKLFLIFQVFRLRNSVETKQRKSIINLLRGEDAGYRDSSYGIRKSLSFNLYTFISANY
jgi:hypothetical protein